MKKSGILLLSGAFSCLTAAYIYNNKLQKSEYTLPEGFTVTAHTGCMGTEDNSIESLIFGAKNADIIEFDVLYRDDGTPVLAHTKAETATMTLEDAFIFLKEKEGIFANVDIKSTEYLENVRELAIKHGVTDKIFFTGIYEKDVSAVQEKCPDITYWLNYWPDRKKIRNREYILSLVNKTKERGAVGINLNKAMASKELVKIFHENGLLVSLWTANNKYTIHRVLSMSADNITTRIPHTARKMIAERTEP